MSGYESGTGFSIPGRPRDPRLRRSFSLRSVTDDYFSALGIPLRRGRVFTAEDRSGAPPVIIINELAASQLFPNELAVGQTIVLGSSGAATVIGVVGDMHHSSLETAPRFQAYVPLLQSGAARVELVVRTVGDPLTAIPFARKAVRDVLPEVPLRAVKTMHQVMAQQTAQRRLNMTLLSLFGLLGLVISAAGLYGVLAYLVVQRSREIGVRMALGSSRTRVVLMVLTRTSLLVTLGLAIGSLGAWYLSAMAEAFLFRMEPSDPRAYAAALGLLLVAAMVASIVPARRAAGIDPLVALREE